MPIDYRSLLMRYMRVVSRCAGGTFLDDCADDDFSREEQEELSNCDSEAGTKRYVREG
jgi:hypothetical protein